MDLSLWMRKDESKYLYEEEWMRKDESKYLYEEG
jgi:hypothetical protein